MTCFEIRLLSSLGARACPASCPHLSGPPKPVPCPQDLSGSIGVRRHGPLMASGCHRLGIRFEGPLREVLES